MPPSRQPAHLGEVQETLLVPLFARAAESRRKRPIVQDPRALEIVGSIDWDFERFHQRRRIVACVLRTAMFDGWVEEFLDRHPEGTVVEIGGGLNTRFERLDNGRAHWFDLDLPDAVELRRHFFADHPRRKMLAGSVVDGGWMAAVEASPGPYFFVAEAVFVYLREAEVREAVARIVDRFPGLLLAFDTATHRAIEGGNKDFERKKMAVRFRWACEHPADIERWQIGLRLVESRTLVDVPDPLRGRLSLGTRAGFAVVRRFLPHIAATYRLNLFQGQRA